MKHTRLPFALLLWILILSTSCDSRANTIPVTTEQLTTESTPPKEAPSETAAKDEAPAPTTEDLKALQSEMNAAMEQKDYEKSGQLAKKIKKIAAQIRERNEVTNPPPKPDAAKESPDSTPAIAQESAQVVDQTAPEATPQPSGTADSRPFHEVQFEQIVEQLEKTKAQAAAPIQQRFVLAVQQLLRRTTQAGDLDAAMKLQAVIDNPEELAAQVGEPSSSYEKELLRLVEQRDKATAVAVAPIQKRFDLETQQLIRKVTQTGDLKAAAKLNAIVKQYSNEPGPSTAKSSPHGFGSQIKESPEKDFEFTIPGDGKTATITKYVGKSSVVRVPSKIQGATVTVIGRQAFEGVENVKEIIFPEGLEKTLHAAFNCYSLKKIFFPASVNQIEGFGNPSQLETIEVDPKNKNYTSLEGVLYNKQFETVMQIPACLKKQNLKVPNTVKNIRPFAGFGCQLKSVLIPQDAVVDPRAFLGSNTIITRY